MSQEFDRQNPLSVSFTHEVPDRVSRNGGDDNQCSKKHNVDVATTGNHAAQDDRSLTGEDKPKEDGGLSENQGKDDDVDHRGIEVENPVKDVGDVGLREKDQGQQGGDHDEQAHPLFGAKSRIGGLFAHLRHCDSTSGGEGDIQGVLRRNMRG